MSSSWGAYFSIVGFYTFDPYPGQRRTTCGSWVLMSGTSADGIDAALVRIGRRGDRLTARLEAFRQVAYPRGAQAPPHGGRRSRRVGAGERCGARARVGERQASAVTRPLPSVGVALATIDLVGCHGHTPAPRSEGSAQVTLQIGDAAPVCGTDGHHDDRVIFAPLTSLPAVRALHLVPAAHAWLFRHLRRGRRRAIQKPRRHRQRHVPLPPGSGLAGVVAFDTGPGNMVIDAIVLAADPRAGVVRSRRAACCRARARVDEALLWTRRTASAFPSPATEIDRRELLLAPQ